MHAFSIRPCCVAKAFFFFLINPLAMHNNHVHIKRTESVPSMNSTAQVATEGRPFRHQKHKAKHFLEDSNQNANRRDGGGGRRGTGRKGAHCIYSLWPFLHQMDITSPQTRPWGKPLSRRSLTHVSHLTTSACGMKSNAVRQHRCGATPCFMSAALVNNPDRFVISN